MVLHPLILLGSFSLLAIAALAAALHFTGRTVNMVFDNDEVVRETLKLEYPEFAPAQIVLSVDRLGAVVFSGSDSDFAILKSMGNFSLVRRLSPATLGVVARNDAQLVISTGEYAAPKFQLELDTVEAAQDVLDRIQKMKDAHSA